MFKKNLLKQVKPAKSFSTLKQEWQTIQSLDIKARYKELRVIAFDVCTAFKDEKIDIAKLEFYIDVLKQVNRIHQLPRCKIALSKMIAQWLELTGNTNAKIIKKIPAKINLITATIAIASASFSNEILAACAEGKIQDSLNLLNHGKAFIFATGSDGEHAVQVRIVESIEPVLSAKEYKCILNATETAMMNIPDGQLIVSDPANINKEKERLTISIEPGNYKVCVSHFFIHNKIDSFYIALCKTNEIPQNTLTSLPQLD